ncbi:hypothetical protein ACH5RR_041013 [Cinchona calisaya]|uniref:RNase H type-1 domain-containing protein n=1 Tax=Cinchona calisaya TaxID=153742 RepID=A0ABD2XUW9_9GENT
MISIKTPNWVHEYQEANKVGNQVPKTQPIINWQPPPLGCFKINFDAAVYKDLQCCGNGVVIRDHLGKFIVALSEKFNNVGSMEYAEMLAAGKAVEFGPEMNLKDFVWKVMLKV